jgi:phosphohistidine phosphatase
MIPVDVNAKKAASHAQPEWFVMADPFRRQTMHMLHLLRHAKSSWREEVKDHERALSRRGREAARQVGHALPAALGTLDLVLCSSARRTRETLELIVAEFAVRPRSVFENELYEASKDELRDRLRRLGEEVGNVLLIGHNPGLRDLAIAIADTNTAGFRTLSSGKFPTAARASFRVPEPWSNFGRLRCELVDYVTADSLPSDRD